MRGDTPEARQFRVAAGIDPEYSYLLTGPEYGQVGALQPLTESAIQPGLNGTTRQGMKRRAYQGMFNQMKKGNPDSLHLIIEKTNRTKVTMTGAIIRMLNALVKVAGWTCDLRGPAAREPQLTFGERRNGMEGHAWLVTGVRNYTDEENKIRAGVYYAQLDGQRFEAIVGRELEWLTVCVAPKDGRFRDTLIEPR